MSGNKIKIVVYSIIIILLGVGGYYYYTYLQQSSQALDESSQNVITKTYANKKLDTTVLQDRKFKELKKIVVESEVIGTATSTAANAVTSVDLASVPRRHSNPFKAF